MSSTGGSAANGSSDPFLSLPNVNPSLSEEESASTPKRPVEEMGMASNDQDSLQQPRAKKRFHRHTALQIQEMESIFKQCPIPNREQRLQLTKDLGLDPKQVKFWFQNKRTQMKAKQDRNDNTTLKTQNDELKSQNKKLEAALRNLVCPGCSGGTKAGCSRGTKEGMCFETHQLLLENARLKKERERVSAELSRIAGRAKHTMGHASHIYPPVMQVATSSLYELMKMCRAAEPLWIQRSDGTEMLNAVEYAKTFPWATSLGQTSNQQSRTEASRGTALVLVNSITLVDTFLNTEKWIEMFPCMISKAKTLQVIAGSPGNFNGSLHLMHAEMQMLSPLVPTREVHFLRYCHQEAGGAWVIVDFPPDGLQDFNHASSFPMYKRKPSGCIIEDMSYGYSKVTWVEHVEVADKPVHQIFNQFVSSGMAFGAAKWLAVLRRQCERLASLMATVPDFGVKPTREAQTNLTNLAKRMIRTFCLALSSSGGQSWTALSDRFEDTVRISLRIATEPGHPIGLFLGAASTTWLPYSQQQVFELLRDERCRAQMEIPSKRNALDEVARIANGSNPGNRISLFRTDGASSSSQTMEFVLQESYTDESESVVAYTTLDLDGVQVAMFGTDPSIIPILPLGFVIVPMNQMINSITGQASSTRNIQQDSGCLLTVGLQVLASTDPNAKLNLSSVNAITNHLHNTIQQINTALSGAGTSGCMP